jgi:HSP20 family protein
MNLFKNNIKLLPSLSQLFDRNHTKLTKSDYSSTNTTVPSLNIEETKDAFKVALAAPGMDKSDFKILVKGNVLSISSYKEFKEEKHDENFFRREFSYQSFLRSLELPADIVDVEHIEAEYKNGILSLVIPKTGEAKNHQAKIINIS